VTGFSGQRFAFRACGDDVTIYELVRILDADRISVGSHVIVDDFAFIDGSGGISIGSHVHIASYVGITGGGNVTIGDYAGLASGTRLVSGSDRFDGSGLTGPTIPHRWRSVHRGEIHIGAHAVLGTNVVVHPDVTIGEGAIVGSQSLVTGDLPAWTICSGVPARPRKDRPSSKILAAAKELEAAEAD
jgi:acetyltransferase-like isoleucine patch superfamily enzyme